MRLQTINCRSWRQVFAVALASALLIGYGTAAQAQDNDLCRELKTPQLVKEHYFDKAEYAETFPCLERMIEEGSYKKNAKVLNDYFFPVLDHYFSNGLGQMPKMTMLLRRALIDVGDAAPLTEYQWDPSVQSAVDEVVEWWKMPAAIKIKPDKARINLNQTKKFQITFYNGAEVELTSVEPSLKTEVRPADKAKTQPMGGEVAVTGAKAGDATLVVRDEKSGASGEAMLTVGGMSVLWPLGATVVGFGGVIMGASADGGASTTGWVIAGVGFTAGAVLWYQYLTGGGVPFLSQADSKPSDGALTYRVVPGLRSVSLRVDF